MELKKKKTKQIQIHHAVCTDVFGSYKVSFLTCFTNKQCLQICAVYSSLFSAPIHANITKVDCSGNDIGYI